MEDEYRVPRRHGYRGAPRNGRSKGIRRSYPRDRRVARQGEDDCGLPRQGLHGRIFHRPCSRPPAQRGRGSGRAEAGAVGAPRRRRRPRLRAALRRRPEEEVGRLGPAQQAREGRPAAARDRRRPRRRGDRLAPRRVAEAEGAGAPDGVPRDHQAGDRARARPRPATSTSASSTRRRRAASSTASTATRSPPSSGGR